MDNKPSFYADSVKPIVPVKATGKWDKKQFIHPDDQSAMDAFHKIPGADMLTRMITSGVAERNLLGLSYATDIRVSEKQLPEIYALLETVSEKLNLGTKKPTLFLQTNPSPNAYTFGVSDIVLVLTTGLLRDLTHEEVQAVIAHECGHIVCEHTLYSTAGLLIKLLGSTVLPGILVEPIKLALNYWSRMAEFSADRVGPMVTDPGVMERALLRISGVPRNITDQVNIEEYLAQIAEYDRRFERTMDKTLMNLNAAYQDHPFTVNRIRALREWTSSIAFQRLRKQIG